MSQWSNPISLAGKPGLSILTGNRAPASTDGVVGQPGWVDTQYYRLYGPKTDQGWPTTYVDLKAAPATLPQNLQANSIILAPVQGETLATQITLKNAAGNTVFTTDAAGAITATSAALGRMTTSADVVVGSTLGVTSAATAGRFVSRLPGSSGSPMLAFTATGSGTSYTCGIYSDNLKSEIYEMVADRLARSITFVGTTPGNSDRSFITHSFYSGVSSAQPAHRFYTGSTLALQILGSAAASFASTVTIGGLMTSAGVKLSSGVLTFADGTTQATASATSANPDTYAASGTGTAASPAFSYAGANNGAGLFFDGAQGNTFLSVNGFKSLYSTSAANAASGASGWAIASTLGAGSALLALFGNVSSTVPVASVDGAGALAAASATLTGLTRTNGLTLSGGVVTFADGTTQSTAATASGGSGGTGGGTGGGTVATTLMPQYGPAAYLNGVTVTAGVEQKAYLPGTTQMSVFTPTQDTALMGVQVCNFPATGAALTVGLYNLTTSATVMSLNVANNTFTGPAYSTTQYPLLAGNQYAWFVSRAGGGLAYVTITPLYFQPITSVVASSPFPRFVTASPTALTTAGVVLQAEGFAPPQRGYFVSATTSYLRTIKVTLKGTGTASFVLSNGTTNLYTTIPVTASAEGTTYTFGPYPSQATQGIPMTGGNSHYWFTSGSGGSCTAEVQMTVV